MCTKVLSPPDGDKADGFEPTLLHAFSFFFFGKYDLLPVKMCPSSTRASCISS